ncbi:MAG: MBOAT family protein, partial [Bacilli bacterium]
MIILNYVFGIILNKKKKKIVIGIGIILNLLILFYFKYFNFSLGYINELFNMNLVLKNIIMPLGISFTFFSCISYLVDIYRGN